MSTLASINLISTDILSGMPTLLGQANEWLPVWVTPLFAIALGLATGVAVTFLFFAGLSLLSFIPAIGNFANDSRRGNIASLALSAIIAIVLCSKYAATVESYGQMLYAPLIVISVILGYATVYGTWSRTRKEWGLILSEGPVPYLLTVIAILTIGGAACFFKVDQPKRFVEAIPQVNLLDDGIRTVAIKVPAAEAGTPADEAPFVPVPQDYDLQSLSEVVIESDKAVILAGAMIDDLANPPFRMEAGDRYVYRWKDGDKPPLPLDPTELHIQNRELNEATVTLTLTSIPKVPEMSRALAMGSMAFLFIAFVVAFRQGAPRVWALGLSTAKNEMSQLLYLILLGLGIFGVVVFAIMPFNTLGNDIRMFKDSTVTLLMILAMLQALWSASTAVNQEIEGRTALTVLSKPVSRRSFILGKYAGIAMSLAVMFTIISAVILVLMAYKPIYEARESAKGLPIWEVGFDEVWATLPVLGLYFMQTLIIAAIAVAFATRLTLLPNFVLCFVVYVIGNLTQMMILATEDEIPLVGFVGKLVAVIVPNLEIFNVQNAVDIGNQIPWTYLAGAFNYFLFFSVAIWMLAMVMFEDRDMA